MAVATAVPDSSPNDYDAVRPFVWTRPLLRQLIAAGVVRESDRVELIESDTTLRYDRLRKMSLYAKYGIKEAWIVNLPERILEVYREPAADPMAWYGFSYHSRTVV